MSQTFLESLRQHRAAAAAERDHWDERIRALDVLIEQESKSLKTLTSSAVGLVSESGFGRRGGSVSLNPLPLPAAVTEALTRQGGTLRFPDLLLGVSQVQGQDVNEKSLRGTLARMVREGKLVNPQRGVYALPTNAESLTVDAVRLSDASDQMPEGGEYTDGQGSHHDHRAPVGQLI